MTDAYDVIIVGGGHNGLVAAGYLARAGRRVLVLERRHTVGGAAVSEQPFGPDFTVTSLSYVVSLLPEAMVRDLRLAEHGYHVYPQGPYFAPRADGRHLTLADDPAARRAEIGKFSARDADAYERWEDMARRARRARRPAAAPDPAQARVQAPRGADRAGRAARPAAQGGRARGVRPDPPVHREHRRPRRGALRVRRDARRCSASPA